MTYFYGFLELYESGNPQESGRGRVKAPGGVYGAGKAKGLPEWGLLFIHVLLPAFMDFILPHMDLSTQRQAT